MEEKFNVRTVLVQYRCDQCHKGFLEPRSNTEPHIQGFLKDNEIATVVMLHELDYKCPGCGALKRVDRHYPYREEIIGGKGTMTDEYTQFSEKMEQPYREYGICECPYCRIGFEVTAIEEKDQDHIVNFCPYCGGEIDGCPT